MTPHETAVFNRCEAFLWTVRCYLHFLAGKAEERLSFDLQPEMAKLLRYHDRLGLLGVERFMKHYFLVAKDVGDLTRTACSSLELWQLKTVPTLANFLGTLPWSNRAKLAATTDFRVDNSRLNVKHPDVFKNDPLNLIRFFVEAERQQPASPSPGDPADPRLAQADRRQLQGQSRSQPGSFLSC